MNYTEVDIRLKPFSQQNAEIIIALLAELGFDSFLDVDEGFLAYIPSNQYSEKDLVDFFNSLPCETTPSYSVKSLKDENWNKQWESNFNPIYVEKLCRIRAPFHKPEKGFKLEIVIEPKMAFGTGHHQTTWLMIRELFNIDLANKVVLDMGCGTGILAIIAEKLGASKVQAVDNDSWAFDNSRENLEINRCSKTQIILGDATALGKDYFDVILANINLNILQNDMPIYFNNLKNNGLLIMSGILKENVDAIINGANQIGLSIIDCKYLNDWALVLTKK